MKLLKGSLLATAAGLAAVSGAQAADLPATKAAPIEYVRICGAYGAGFFYIPGTDTCLRISGRARFETGYGRSLYRGNGLTAGAASAANGFGITNGNQGDTMGYIGLLRLNVDARTQTSYGVLRAFLRWDAASRSGATQGIRSGTQERVARAFGATGQDQSGRLQEFVNVDKAFIQFAGFTAGRASSFFDFYAHDYEFQAATAGSDVQSTNLIAYTYTADGGVSATLSMEDPMFRKNTIYSQESTAVNANSRVLTAVTAAGVPTYIGVDVTERSRMPDFVGVLRYDQPWGSLQLSAAVKDLNVGGFGTTSVGAALIPATTLPVTQRVPTEYGWAVQGGVKFNLPFIAPGDGLYLQGAYGQGATVYTGYSAYDGTYASQASTINGAPFTPFLSDGTLNPFTGKIQQSESYTVVGSYLHYWTPEWRSAFFGSYGALNFANNARLANYLAYSAPGSVITTQNFIGAVGSVAQGGIFSRSFALSPVLRDTYQYVAGASLIWSPVKDLDIGIEGMYTRINLRSGRVVDQTQAALVTAAAVNAGAFVKTVSGEDTYQARLRVQRDF